MCGQCKYFWLLRPNRRQPCDRSERTGKKTIAYFSKTERFLTRYNMVWLRYDHEIFSETPEIVKCHRSTVKRSIVRRTICLRLGSVYFLWKYWNVLTTTDARSTGKSVSFYNIFLENDSLLFHRFRTACE